MKNLFKSAYLLILLLAFACTNSTPEPAYSFTEAPLHSSKKGAKTSAYAPSNLAGWWKFTGYVEPNWTIGNYSTCRAGCSAGNRWLYISPANYQAYIIDGDGCYPGSLSEINAGTYCFVEYFIWRNFSGENVYYQYSPTSSTTGYFELYRGSYGVTYTNATVFNAGGVDQLQLCTHTGDNCFYWRKQNPGEFPPSTL